MRAKLVVTAILAIGTMALTSLVLAPASVAADKEKKDSKQQVSRKVQKPLGDAQAAMKKEDWSGALAKIKEAQAVSDRTPYDDYQINEFLGYVSQRAGDLEGAAAAYAQVLDSEFVPAEQKVERSRQLTALNFQLKHYDKARDFAQKWIDATGGSDPNAYLALGQSQYILENDPAAIEAMRKGIDLTRQANAEMNEQWFEILLSAYDRSGNKQGVYDTLVDMVRYFPSKQRWEQAFTQLQVISGELDNRTLLNLYRLMFETGALKKGEDYVDLGELATEAGLPGETVSAYQAGFDAKLLEDKDKARRTARLAEAKKQAEGDRKALPGLEKEAAAGKAGEPDVAVGSAYLTYGEYDKAVEALKRGIGKGGLKRPDEAQITLGRALLKLNRKDEAKAAFAAVPESSKLARVAQLWAIYAGQQA
jgi:tetratricopeptide (TPR) repeat protein